MTATRGVTEPTAKRAPGRRRPLVIGAVALALFAVAAGIGQLSTKAPGPPGVNVGTQIDTTMPAEISQLPLTDEYGHSTDLAAFKGKIVVMADFMTLCQEVCPITTAELNDIDAHGLSPALRDKIEFVNITVDPGRDDPARLHAYRTFAQLMPNWTLLTGTSANLAKLWNYFGASYSIQPEGVPASLDWLTGKPLTYDVEHSDELVYLDATGAERFVIEGMPNGANAPLTAGERGFLSADGRADLTDTADAAWTEPQALQVVSWLTKKHLHVTH
jgi:protein SCO1